MIGSRPLRVRHDFSAQLGSQPLQAVRWLSNTELEATLGEPLAGGSYDLTVTTPAGALAWKDDAVAVRADTPSFDTTRPFDLLPTMTGESLRQSTVKSDGQEISVSEWSTANDECLNKAPASKSWDSDAGFRLAGRTRLELAASGVTGRRYNQLNYRPNRVTGVSKGLDAGST